MEDSAIGNIHDAKRTPMGGLLTYGLVQQTGKKERSALMDGDILIPCLGIDLFQGDRSEDRGAIDQTIDPAKRIQCRLGDAVQGSHLA